MFDFGFKKTEPLTKGMKQVEIPNQEVKMPDEPIGGKGIDSVLSGLFQSVFGGNEKGGGVEGVDTFGDFDPFSYVNNQVKKGMDGDNDGLTKVIGSLMKMFGG